MRHDALSSAMLFLIGLSIALYAPTFELGTLAGPGSGFMPFLTGVVICASALVTFVSALRSGAAETERLWKLGRLKKVFFLLALLGAYGALLELLGFLICSFVLIVAVMRYIGRDGWLSSLMWAALASGGAYLLFALALKAALPRGVLGF